MTDETRAFRKTIRQFIQTELLPRQAIWRQQHYASAEAWLKAGQGGFLLTEAPGEFGGGGRNFAFEAVVLEELARSGVHFGVSIQSIVARYIHSYGTAEQKRQWLLRMARGEVVAAVAMTEPAAGSDLQGIQTLATREGDHFVINGTKTLITNGARAGLICLAVKTDPKATGPRAMSLLLVDTKDLAGFRAGPPLEKVGRHGQDVAELFFTGARVPVSCLLGGEPGKGFSQLMGQLPYERLSVAVAATATMERAVELTVQHVKERNAFGKPLLDLQNTRMKLADCATEARVGRTFVDDCIGKLIAGKLDAITAAMAKYWCTDREFRVVDECLQLHGGRGYLTDTPIARLWADCRAERIYAGTNEVMKEMIAWSL